jgi:hypothetical protein
MKELKQVKALKSGWSRWQVPEMKGYIMGCCDCGLEHEVEFEVMEAISKPNSKGWTKYTDVKNGRVRMRMRRV